MRTARQHAEHAGSIRVILRLAENRAIHDDDGIGGEHWSGAVGAPFKYCPGLLACHALSEMPGRLAGIRNFWQIDGIDGEVEVS